MQTYGYGFVFSLTGYLGVNVVLTLVKSFGALLAVTGKTLIVVTVFVKQCPSMPCILLSKSQLTIKFKVFLV